MDYSYLVSDDFPVTVLPARHAMGHLPVKRKKVSRETKRKDLTVADYRELCAAKGLKTVSAHTKRELIAMLATGEYAAPAAYARAKAKREQAKAANLVTA